MSPMPQIQGQGQGQEGGAPGIGGMMQQMGGGAPMGGGGGNPEEANQLVMQGVEMLFQAGQMNPELAPIIQQVVGILQEGFQNLASGGPPQMRGQGGPPPMRGGGEMEEEGY